MFTLFYCGLLAGSSVCFWNELQDATLLPRILFAMLWLLAFAPIWVKYIWDKPVEVKLPDLFFCSYVFFHALSVKQALNAPEAIFETEKILTVFISYMLFRIGLTQKLITEAALLKTLAFICLGYGLFGVSQLNSLIDIARPEGDNLYAINALAGHKNLYSGLLVTTSCLLAILAITEISGWRYFASTLIVFQLIMLIVLQTRSAFLAFIAAILIIAVLGIFVNNIISPVFIKKAALPTALVVGGVVLFLFYNGTFSSLYDRLNVANYLNSDTGAERLGLWYKSSFLLRDHWLWGVGARNWVLVYPYYTFKGMFRMMYLNVSFLQPHNDFLWVWCELGVLGFVSFVGMLLSFLYNSLKGIAKATQLPDKVILILLSAYVVGFMVFSFFDFPKERMEHQITLALCFSLISYRTTNNSQGFKVKPTISKLFITLSIVVLAVAFWGTYQRMKADSLFNDMMAASNRGDNESVVLLVDKMETPFSELTPIAFPKYWYKGVALYSLGKYDEAYNCFKIAKQQSPYNPNVLNNLGGLQTYFKHYNEALTTYKETLRINDKNDDARFNTAYTLYQLGRYQEALDTVEKVWSNKAKKQEFVQIISQARDSVNNIK